MDLPGSRNLTSPPPNYSPERSGTMGEALEECLNFCVDAGQCHFSASSGGVHRSRRNWLVEVYVSVSYLYVKPAWWIDADPSLKVHGSALSTIVRQRDQITHITLQALGHSHLFHKNLLPHLRLRRVYRPLCWDTTKSAISITYFDGIRLHNIANAMLCPLVSPSH